MTSARRVTFPKAGEKHRFRPVIRARAAAVFLVSDVLTEKGWSGFVAGRKGADLDRAAGVACAFALLGKKY